MAYFLANSGGVLPISQGGTGATTAANALKNLGITTTATKLNYCDGVTSNIQTQLNNLLKKTSWTKITSGGLASKGVTISSSIDWSSLRVELYFDYGSYDFWGYSKVLTKMMFPSNNTETWHVVLGGYSNGAGTDVGYGGIHLGRSSSSGGDYIITLENFYMEGVNRNSSVLIEVEYM